MLTQEEYMDVLSLHRQGFTISEIAEQLGYHPANDSGAQCSKEAEVKSRSGAGCLKVAVVSTKGRARA